jgi:hypothetical protein
LSDTSNPALSWQLPPAPGQFGAPAPTPEQQQTLRQQQQAPYGFRRVDPIGVPPFNRYIPTNQNPALRDRPPGDWAKDDWVLAGMKAYPEDGMPDGMHVPSEQDIPPIIHNSVTTFGRYGAPSVAMPMIASGNYYNAARQNWMTGNPQQAKINQQQMLSSMKLALYNHDLMIDQYGNAFAAYGSKDGKGGDSEKLLDRLWEIAYTNNDGFMKQLIERGDIGPVENLLHHLDGQGQDLKKAKELLEIQLAQERLKAAQAKSRAAEEQLAPYRQAPAAVTPTSPAAPSAPGIGSPADMGPPPTGIPAAPETFDPEHPPVDTDTDTAAPGATDAVGGEQAQAAPAPTTTMAAIQAGRQVAQAAQPRIQLAQADTGIATDARGLGPVPSDVPAQPFKMLPSATLDSARKAGFLNTDLIEQSARAAANRQLTIQDYRNIPPEIRSYVGARAQELRREYDRILNDPKITGEKVYQAISTFDPGFAGTLRAYVDGKAPPPASAWQNPVYRDRVVGLGNKVDPTFSYLTFKNRAATLASFSHGQDHRNLLAVGTAEQHVQGLLDSLPDKPGGGRPIFNYIQNKWIEWAENPNAKQQWLAAWETNADVAANEIAKATSGAAPHQTEIDFWKNELGTHRNAAQLAASLNRARSLLAGRLNELKASYQAGVGRDPITGISNLLERDIWKAGTPAEEKAANQAVLRELQPRAAPSKTAPVPGRVEDGWRFKGGDPGKQENWERAQ